VVFGDGVLDVAAVSGLADDLDVVGAREKMMSAARTSASSSTTSTRIRSFTAATAAMRAAGSGRARGAASLDPSDTLVTRASGDAHCLRPLDRGM